MNWCAKWSSRIDGNAPRRRPSQRARLDDKERMSAPVIFELRGKRVYVAGHAGMVGAAIVRRLEREQCKIITVARRELDLRQSEAVERFLAQTKPDAVFVAAGKVGGISANSAFPADFLADNLAIACNTIHAAYRSGVREARLSRLVLHLSAARAAADGAGNAADGPA